MPIILPTTKILPTRQSPKILLLYGMPKVGKTTILSELDNTLIIDLEKGSEFVTALKIGVNNLNELSQTLDAIISAGRPYKRIAVDTVTKMEEWCEVDATNRYRNSPIGKNFTGNSVLELPNGGGYLYLRQSFSSWISKFKNCASELILVGHLKEKYLGGRASVSNGVELAGRKDTVEVLSKEIDLTGKIKNIACADADAVGYLYRNNNHGLSISFETSEEVNCGSRCKHLAGAKFEFDWKKIYID